LHPVIFFLKGAFAPGAFVHRFVNASASVPCASNRLGEWVIDYAIFLLVLAQQWRPRKKRNLAQSLGGEDDARTSNTLIVQRKRAIPHSTMKNNGNIIQCCNNTHQGASRTGKQTCACASDVGDGSHVTC